MSSANAKPLTITIVRQQGRRLWVRGINGRVPMAELAHLTAQGYSVTVV